MIKSSGLRKDNMGPIEFWAMVSINIFLSLCNLGFGLKYHNAFHLVVGAVVALICLTLLYRRFSK